MYIHRRYQIKNKTLVAPSHNLTIKTIDKRTALAAGLQRTIKHGEMHFLFEKPSWSSFNTARKCCLKGEPAHLGCEHPACGRMALQCNVPQSYDERLREGERKFSQLPISPHHVKRPSDHRPQPKSRSESQSSKQEHPLIVLWKTLGEVWGRIFVGYSFTHCELCSLL